jgi:2-amino-4-hydroxy-6-hydroxymethyldihydropteridine diphosphokinase
MAELVYLSLGSNLGDRAANLRAAIERLAEIGNLVHASSFYETEPVDVPNQPWFMNCVIAIETDLSAKAVLAFALRVEEEMGRLRTRDKGPRSIDIDILLFDDQIMEQQGLRIPHPAMHVRRFVLEPLVEIAPEAFHPVLNKSARQLLAALPEGQSVRKVAAGKSTER